MVRMRNKLRIQLLLAAAAVQVTNVPGAFAQAANSQEYNLPVDDLGSALRAVSRLSGREIIFDTDAVAGKRAPRLQGRFNADNAVKALLRGSGLFAEYRKDVILIRGRTEASGLASDPANVVELFVTGSRIRGTEPVSQVIAATRSDIVRRGRSDLGAYARDLPQNYSGGQNPGVVGAGAQGGNENLTSSSTLNLRGLGADATLTLVNGHRIAYDGVSQGVDISSIPLAAVDRIEIVADGASALYGSDAVAGVANIILRRDFEGLWTSARFGTTTRGGGTEQQYSAVTGSKWSTGGILATADYRHSTGIRADQRSFADSVDGSATLIPRQRQISAIVSGHQELGDTVTFEFDGQYSNRRSTLYLPSFVDQDVFTNGTITRPRVETFSITPSLRVSLPGSWEARLNGTYGIGTSKVPGDVFTNGSHSSHRDVRYRNATKNVEGFAEGPLFHLPGGDLRLALGAGYRSVSLDADSSLSVGTSITPIQSFDRHRDVAYAFGEVAIPIVGEGNSLPLIHSLLLTGALRYEKHYDVGHIAAPKVGIVYHPDGSIAVRASWGKSFKAPTLYDQSRGYQTLLLPASFFGASNAGANDSVLYAAGGNGDLKPERATTWSATVEVSPQFDEGLKISGSYFHIRYKNRVGTPMSSLFGLLTNPLYSAFVQSGPSAEAIDALTSSALFGLENLTGGTYDPTNVIAIIDNRLQNISTQSAHGFDLALNYSMKLGSNDKLNLTGSASYLKSDLQLVPGQASIQKAGTIFNPPHWRAQAGGTWDHEPFSLTVFGSYIGGTVDNRLVSLSRVKSFFSVDLVAQWRSSAPTGALKDVEASLSVSNLFDRAPSSIRSASSVDPGFDSTNYPATGRAVSLTLSKKW